MWTCNAVIDLMGHRFGVTPYRMIHASNDTSHRIHNRGYARFVWTCNAVIDLMGHRLRVTPYRMIDASDDTTHRIHNRGYV